jgi:hypothetical protein
MVVQVAHLAQVPPLWDGVVSAVSLVARGSADHSDFDSWRSYLIRVSGTGQVPAAPSDPVRGARGAPVEPARALLVLDGELQLDGGSSLPVGVVSHLPPQATLSGDGRAVVLERLSEAGRQAALELVELGAGAGVAGRERPGPVRTGRARPALAWNDRHRARSRCPQLPRSPSARLGAPLPRPRR